MSDSKLLKNVTIRLDRTQAPPAPHSIRPKEEERLRIYRDVVEVLQLARIPVAYAYSVPEQSAILGYLRRETEQEELLPEDRKLSIEDRIRQLVRELQILKRPPESLRTDLKGYLQDGGLMLRHAPLVEWFEALNRLGRQANPVSEDGTTYVFPLIISLEEEDFRIPAMPLELFRDRIARIRQGQWPRETLEKPDGKPGSSKGPGGVKPKSGPDDDELEPDDGSGREHDKHETITLRLSALMPVAKGHDGQFYRLPDSISSEELPGTLRVSVKKSRLGSLYDLSECITFTFNAELKFHR